MEMAKRREITKKQLKEIQATRKGGNQDKNIDRRLMALELHESGIRYKEIAEKTGFAVSYVGELVKKYLDNGINAIAGNNYKGNHRLLTFEEEAALLEPFKARAKAGQLITINEIKQAYILAAGKEPGSAGHMYRVLKRHNFQQVMPRSKHRDVTTL